jgi:NADH dehydrogenase
MTTESDQSFAQKSPPEIVAVGGGAAGLELATLLGNRLGRRGRAKVALVECARAHLWKPLLHEVAAGSLDPDAHEVSYLAQAHWHGFRYRLGEMIGLDRAGKQVHLAAMFDDEGLQITPARDVHYDLLVIAIGSVTNDFATPGVAQYAVPLETPAQAARFNRRLVTCARKRRTGRSAPVSFTSRSSAPARPAPSLPRSCIAPCARSLPMGSTASIRNVTFALC